MVSLQNLRRKTFGQIMMEYNQNHHLLHSQFFIRFFNLKTINQKTITRVEHLGGKGLVQLVLGVIIAVKGPITSPNELMLFI